MPRKKQNKVPKTPKILPAAVIAPQKTSRILIALAIAIILFFIWLFFSLAGFFLPIITLPFFSFMNRMDISDYSNFPGSPTLRAPADYRISQTDDYPVSMSVNIPFFNIASRGNFSIVSQGLVVSLAAPGDPDWKTEWKIYQDIVYDADLEGGVHMEERQGAKHLLVDIPGKGIKAKSSGHSVLTFSLAGVREGGTFPIKIDFSDGSSQMQSAEQETKFIDRDPESGTNIDMRGKVDYNKEDTTEDQTMSATGKLIKDNGEEGALITIGSTEMPQAYKDAALQAREIARQYNAPYGLQNLYDDSGKINNDSGIAAMDYPAAKPLKIFLAANVDQNQTETNTKESRAGIANPASVYCVKQGGKSEIKTERDGGQVGYCNFANGSSCEEWQYFRGDCSPGKTGRQ